MKKGTSAKKKRSGEETDLEGEKRKEKGTSTKKEVRESTVEKKNREH